MKKMSLIAGVATAAALATVLWSIPASAETTDWREAHDKWPGQDDTSRETTNNDTDAAATGIPEPGTLALLTLGLGGLGLAALARKRVKA